MHLEIRHYQYFAALAEELHFGRAAERLGISQPALSQQLRIIESEVGAPPLSRANSQLALTEVGAVVYDEALRILRQVRHAEMAMSRASRGETGGISIGYVASAALSGVLPKLLHGFRQDHPDVQFAIREMSMRAQISAVEEGELDLGFVRRPVQSLPEGLALFNITTDSVVVVLHTSHALSQRKRIDVDRLRDETFICTHTEEGTGFYATTLDICHAAGFGPGVRALSSQMSTIISIVAAGFGVAFIPESMSNFSQPDVVFRPLIRNDVVSDLAVVHRKNASSPALLRLIERCRMLARRLP